MTGGDQPDLLNYPRTPGWQAPDTSIDAAEAIAPSAGRLRDRVLRAIREREPFGGLTADEAAALLDLTPFTVRPRVTELNVDGEIADSGLRRRNESGRLAIVWVPVDGRRNPGENRPKRSRYERAKGR